MPAFTTKDDNLKHFAGLRFGMFVHFGLYSLLGRGEWALNRELIPVDEYKSLADRFTCADFDAKELVSLAQSAGAKYLTFTTMHHDGFALYDSKVNPFNSVNFGPKRDLVAEVVDACRDAGLRIHLYHSLNHWTCDPDGPAALEDDSKRKAFVDFAHERIRELVTLFNPIDCMWYDGWWPFNAEGWRAEDMNAMVSEIQPHILFNGRNGLPGDFATPEQHLTAPHPWRSWEACVTHNTNWGFHMGDSHFKPSEEIINMVTQVAQGAGNLLMNVGPDSRGAVPLPSRAMLEQVGDWLEKHGEAVYDSDPFGYDMQTRDGQRGDWQHMGRYTAKGNNLYVHVFNWPGATFSIGGLQQQARAVELLGSTASVGMKQDGPRLTFDSLPDAPPHPAGGVIKVTFDEPPVLYHTGGLRVANSDHPRYDPCPSDIA